MFSDTTKVHDENVTAQVREVMADTFGIDVRDLPESASQETFARWTSILHMVLLVALEERFGLTFSMDAMTSMTSLDRILDVLGYNEAVEQPA